MPKDENKFVERLLVMALYILLSVEILLMISSYWSHILIGNDIGSLYVLMSNDELDTSPKR